MYAYLLYTKYIKNVLYKQGHILIRDRVVHIMTDTTFPVTITEAAANKAHQLLTQEGREDMRLRVQVTPGGCSGLRYALFFDEQILDGDETAEFGDIEVVVDKMSAPYLSGAKIDFEDTIQKQGFNIENPNAAGTCACGDSFH